VVENTVAKVLQFLYTTGSILQALQQRNEAEAKPCKEVVLEIRDVISTLLSQYMQTTFSLKDNSVTLET
jgi:hypothetical protein